MRNSAIVVLLCFLLSASLGHVEPRLWLELEIMLEREVYTLNQRIDVELTVINRGRLVTGFWREFSWDHHTGNVEYAVTDSKGERVKSYFVIDDFNVDRLLDKVAPELVILAPGERVCTSQSFRVSDLVSKPGKYTLFVGYRAPKIDADTSVPVWDRGEGPLIGSVHFEVVDGTGKEP